MSVSTKNRSPCKPKEYFCKPSIRQLRSGKPAVTLYVLLLHLYKFDCAKDALVATKIVNIARYFFIFFLLFHNLTKKSTIWTFPRLHKRNSAANRCGIFLIFI